jgi:FkbM family methyltransferase
MKVFELRRLNVLLMMKVIAAYIGTKLLRVRLIDKQDELIAYFNHLAKLKIRHKKSIGKYFLVCSPEFGEFYLRKPYSSDYKVFEQVFLDKEYSHLAERIDQLCPADTITMIDGGGNIGLTTIFIHRFFKGRKVVRSIVVEPFEDNINLAKMNFEIQGMKSVYYEKAGLYNKKCYLKIDNKFRDEMEWSVQIVESPEKTDLESIEINEIFDKYNIQNLDVLKLDIEGAEAFLFKDEEYANEFLKKLKIIAIELHNEYNINEKVLCILKKNNFDLVKFGEMYIGTKQVMA